MAGFEPATRRLTICSSTGIRQDVSFLFIAFRMGQADKFDCETETLSENVVPQGIPPDPLFHTSIFSISPTQ